VAGTGVRGVLVLLLCWGGWWMFTTYRAVFSGSPKVEFPRPPAVPTPDVDLSTLAGGLLPPGGWTFGESQLSVTLQECSAAEKQARLRSVGSPLPARPQSQEERQILDWVHRAARRPTKVENCQVYRLTVQRAEGRLVTDGDGDRERIRLGQLAWPAAEGTWAVVDLRPLAAPAGAQAAVDMLPLPATVQALARRWDNRGRLVGEVILRAPPLDQLVESWRRAGWQVETAVSGSGWDAGAFCARDQDHVQALRFPGPAPEAGDCLILLLLPLQPSAQDTIHEGR
jgi:hypothetical protein